MKLFASRETKRRGGKRARAAAVKPGAEERNEAPLLHTQVVNTLGRCNNQESKVYHRDDLSLTTMLDSLRLGGYEDDVPAARRAHSAPAALRSQGPLQPIHRHDSTTTAPDSDHLAGYEPIQPQQLVCQCCFDDISPSDFSWVACTNAEELHCFCADCLRRYVEEWVFGGASYPLWKGDEDDKVYLPCLSPDCKVGYVAEEAVEHVVSNKVWLKYTEKMVRVRYAEPQGLVVRVESPPVSPKPKKSGRENSTSSKNSLDESCHAVEEALTNAKVRKCPVCHTRFLKEADSCNKMRCPNCKWCVCYICREPVPSKGYDHFCNHKVDVACGECGCSCPLWTKQDDATDESKMREIAQDMANRVWEQSLLDKSSEEIKLDVERLLHVPTARRVDL